MSVNDNLMCGFQILKSTNKPKEPKESKGDTKTTKEKNV